jgi:hypothetical protein
MAARRIVGSGKSARTGDAGCSSSEVIVAADIMKRPRPATSIRYSRQCNGAAIVVTHG